MTNEKKPSIYDDRGTIGSADELDEYGVWVKSEPQDLSPEFSNIPEPSPLSAEDSAETFDISDIDPDIPEIDDYPDFDTDSGGSSLSDENMLDISTEDFSLPEEEESEGEVFDIGEIPVPDDSDIETELKGSEESLDSIDVFDSDKTTESLDTIDSTDSIDLIDFDEPISFTESDNSLTISDISDESETSLEEDSGFTEVSMDDFIGTLDTEPEEPEHIQAIKEPEKQEAIGQQDLSTQLLMKIAEELSSIRSELSNLKKEFSGLKAASQAEEEGADEDFFGEEDDEKISLTGDELNNILNTADFTEEAGSDATVDFSEELSLGESEDISNDPDISAEGTAKASEATDDLDSLDIDISLGGTSLEGLETESKPEEAIPESENPLYSTESFDISMDEDSRAAIDDDVLRISDLDTVNLGEADDTLPEFDTEETDELKFLRENGAEPMTFAPAPEDSDYLENDPHLESMEEGNLSSDEFADGEVLDLSTETSEDISPETSTEDTVDFSQDFSENLSADSESDEPIDLSSAVIDEPDLSLDVQDNPLEEPSLEDISISLDLDESAFTTDPGAEEEDEGFGSTDPGTDMSLIPEGFEVEPEDSLPEDSAAPFEEADEVLTIPEAEEEASGDSEIAGDLPSFDEISFDDIQDDSSLPSFDEVSPDNDLPSLDEVSVDEVSSDEDLPSFDEVSVDEVSSDDGLEQDAPADLVSGKIPGSIKQELKTVLTYMDQLLEALPDDKIEEFAKSEYFDTYKKLFKELGLA